MAPRIWNAYEILSITDRGSYDMFCVGHSVTKGNARCRYHISGENFAKVLLILDEMETKPPNEASELLPRLARLSLCEEYHREQKHEVLVKWKGTIEDVLKLYEKCESLKRRNQRLSTELAKESEERKRLEGLLLEGQDEAEGSSGNTLAELSAQVDELGSQLTAALATSSQYRQEYIEAEASRASLSMRVGQLQMSLTESLQESERLEKVLAEQEAELLRQLTAERQASEECSRGAEASLASQTQLINNLRSELVQERQTSAQHQNDLEAVTAKQATLSTEADEMQSQLTTERETLEISRKDQGEAMTDRTDLLAQIESLQAQLSTECENSEQLQETVDEAETKQAVLSDEIGTLQSQLAAGRQITDRLQAAAETRDAASWAETARMFEQIHQLERQASATFLSAFWGKIKTFARLAAHWAARARF